ncbi:hypothetical protein JCM19376_05100 [Fusibacter bizertensis]
MNQWKRHGFILQLYDLFGLMLHLPVKFIILTVVKKGGRKYAKK